MTSADSSKNAILRSTAWAVLLCFAVGMGCGVRQGPELAILTGETMGTTYTVRLPQHES